MGETTLCDSYAGSLEITGNQLLIGKDTGWFSVSGGTGGGGPTQDVSLRDRLRSAAYPASGGVKRVGKQACPRACSSAAAPLGQIEIVLLFVGFIVK